MNTISINTIPKLLLSFICLIVFSLSPVQPSYAQSAPPNFQPPNSLADLAEGLLDSVVNISTSQDVKSRAPSRSPRPQVPEGSPFQEFFDRFHNDDGFDNNDSQRRAQSLGSGFVIDASGVIITNNHVIARSDEILVDFADGTQLTAEIIGTDPKLDIAVLQVEPESPLTAVEFGDSDKVRIGDWALAIGNPFGQGSSVSLGIVSAINRDINAGPYDNFIQTDAAINRGNSGGPLFNMKGEVIGVNTAIISPTGGSIGLGFSIPANLALSVIEQLREFGETRRGWLGVSISPVTDDIAESLDLSDSVGALVASVIDGGPAEASGIRVGDVILRFDSQDVEKMRDLPRIVAETEIGKRVDVIVWRKGEEQTVQVTVGRLEGSEVSQSSVSESSDDDSSTILGLSLSELTESHRSRFSIEDDIDGVLISNVSRDSQAYDKGVRRGDVIAELGQEEVNTPSDVEAQLDQLLEQGRTKALFLLKKPDGDVNFVVLSIEGLTR